jgi:hypothetical protein
VPVVQSVLAHRGRFALCLSTILMSECVSKTAFVILALALLVGPSTAKAQVTVDISKLHALSLSLTKSPIDTQD